MSSVGPIALVVAIAAALLPPQAGPMQQLTWVDRAGTVIGSIGQPRWSLLYTAISPDATKVAVRVQESEKGKPSVWIFDAASGTGKRLTADAANEGQPAWSPTGDRLAYLSYRNGLGDLFVRTADGSGSDVQLTSSPETQDFAPSWSPDGTTIVFHTQDPKGGDRNVMYVGVSGGRAPEPVSNGPAQEALASFSPDGRFIVYQSNESGRMEVYVKPFPLTEAKWQVSTNGGVWPRWSGRGDELFFLEGTTFMAASIRLKPAFEAGKAQRLFTTEQVGMDLAPVTQFNPIYDATRDGRKFVVVRRIK